MTFPRLLHFGLTLLASLSPLRDSGNPDVPTAREQGYPVSLSSWRGIAAPKTILDREDAMNGGEME